MTITTTRLNKLRQPLLGALFAIFVAGAGSYWSKQYWLDAQQENVMSRQQKARMQERLNLASADAAMIDARLMAYRKIQKTGAIGDEQQQEWQKTLLAIRQERHALPIRYELGEKVPLGEISGPHLATFGTRLHLDAEVSHEVDLIHLISRLEKEIKALPILQHCRLERAANPSSNLSASCEFELIALLPKSEAR